MPETAEFTVPQQPNYPLTTDRLQLRPVVLEDVEAVNFYRSMPEVARYLPHPPQDLEASLATVRRMAEESVFDLPGQWLDFAVELKSTGNVVGEVLLKWEVENTNCGEIGFAFAPEVQGQGIAYEAAHAALKVAFEDFGWHRVVGICDDRNTKSAALLERLGMRLEAHTIESEFSKDQGISLKTFAMLRREWLA